MDTAALFREADELCRKLAPIDLAGVPVYVVPRRAIDVACAHGHAVGGFTGASLDLFLRDVIGADWRGRGVAMVIDEENPLVACGSPRDGVLSIAAHELAHVVERRDFLRGGELYAAGFAVTNPAAIAWTAEVLTRNVTGDIDTPFEAPPYDSHEAGFIRGGVHLEHRARILGVRLLPEFLLPHTQYGLSRFRYYRAALGDEPVRMSGASFREIHAADPPAGFRMLWDDDVELLREHAAWWAKRTPLTATADESLEPLLAGVRP